MFSLSLSLRKGKVFIGVMNTVFFVPTASMLYIHSEMRRVSEKDIFHIYPNKCEI